MEEGVEGERGRKGRKEGGMEVYIVFYRRIIIH